MSLFHISTQRVTQHCKLDASKKGLGAVILQNLKPVMFASRGLDWSREELPKLGEGMLSNDLGNGEISLLSLWQTVHT